MSLILNKIIEQKEIRLKDETGKVTLEDLQQKLKEQQELKDPYIFKPRDFFSAIKNKTGTSIIGEIKKASPTCGIIRKDFNPVELAKEYDSAGVEALSVLTERDFFMGDNTYLTSIKETVYLPILRKDFIIDPWQIYESRDSGADAILLIVSLLTNEKLKEFLDMSHALGMDCIAEVHNITQVETALQAGAMIIGINNRDLNTFEINIDLTEQLVKHIPKEKAIISESGIKTHEDFCFLKSLGIDAVLIGETFMRSPSIINKVNELRTGESKSYICQIK